MNPLSPRERARVRESVAGRNPLPTMAKALDPRFRGDDILG